MWWAHFDQICERTLRVLSKGGSGVHWWAISEQIQNLPTDPIKIKVVSTLRICPPFTCWAKYRLEQVRLEQVRLEQVKLGEVRLC